MSRFVSDAHYKAGMARLLDDLVGGARRGQAGYGQDVSHPFLGFLLTLDGTACARCKTTLTAAEIIEKHCITCAETARAKP